MFERIGGDSVIVLAFWDFRILGWNDIMEGFGRVKVDVEGYFGRFVLYDSNENYTYFFLSTLLLDLWCGWMASGSYLSHRFKVSLFQLYWVI